MTQLQKTCSRPLSIRRLVPISHLLAVLTAGQCVAKERNPRHQGDPIIHFLQAQVAWDRENRERAAGGNDWGARGRSSTQAGASRVVALAAVSVAALSGKKHNVALCTHQQQLITSLFNMCPLRVHLQRPAQSNRPSRAACVRYNTPKTPWGVTTCSKQVTGSRQGSS
jgi:hypothetical protein